MNKVLLSLRFKSYIPLTALIWYLGCYIFVMFLTTYILIQTYVISGSSGGLFYRVWGAIFFLFAISLRFKEDYNFLLTLSITRKDIFNSLLLFNIGFSVLISIIIVIERVLVDQLNTVFSYHNITDIFHFIAPYRTNSLLLQFLFFFALCCSVSMFGMLMGSLFYRFGKLFTWGFWIAFSAIPLLIFPALIWIFYITDDLSSTMASIGGFFKNFDLMAGSGNLIIPAVIFSVIAYLNIRRMPQQ